MLNTFNQFCIKRVILGYFKNNKNSTDSAVRKKGSNLPACGVPSGRRGCSQPLKAGGGLHNCAANVFLVLAPWQYDQPFVL